jgi:hypothetical protein
MVPMDWVRGTVHVCMMVSAGTGYGSWVSSGRPGRQWELGSELPYSRINDCLYDPRSETERNDWLSVLNTLRLESEWLASC